eukprot:CAMPEP_0197476966 /NCGR_PEP_ID=MMETSP1309-20131121/12368_1 /TAXON_ID=464262 /ORGANISM="Genus nov. species nov., Strain RCC998" /LENGTH=48 /DNA_ID= /DNA_START= /DNA_END= /DNA_ORIENTATION=
MSTQDSSWLVTGTRHLDGARRRCTTLDRTPNSNIHKETARSRKLESQF